MRHISTEDIANYIEGRASAQDVTTMDLHLIQCKECAELKQEFQSLLNSLREDSAFEPPAELVQWGIELFQPVVTHAAPVGLPRFIASLVFDTFDQPMFAGVRRVGTPPRQLLFRAGEVDVD